MSEFEFIIFVTSIINSITAVIEIYHLASRNAEQIAMESSFELVQFKILYDTVLLWTIVSISIGHMACSSRHFL